MRQLTDVDLFSNKYCIAQCHPLMRCFYSCPRTNCLERWHFFNVTKSIPLPDAKLIDCKTFTMMDHRGLRKQAEYEKNLRERISGRSKNGCS